jgi:spermidine synthase
MTIWKLLDTAQIPGNGGELELHQQDAEFSIGIAGGANLMNTWEHSSEDALAELACRKFAGHPHPRVLIGGLGMGFTLAAALRLLGPGAQVVVAELVPEVVEWNRGPLGAHAGYPLLDDRTRVREGDVAKLLKSEKKAYDAILLDVDNGPEGLTRKRNEWLYSMDGLTVAYTALRPQGTLAVWSAGPDGNFTERLKKTGFKVRQSRVRARQEEGALHTIWLAERIE